MSGIGPGLRFNVFGILKGGGSKRGRGYRTQ